MSGKTPMAGIGVILNPYSKKYKKNPRRLDRMAFIVGDKASCKPTDDLDDLYRVADEFKSRSVDILAISGGDGTIHCTITAFLKVYGEKPLPKITLLRGGTLNTIAATLGIFGTTEHLLSDLLVRYHEDLPFEERKLRLMRINDDYGCIFGNGAVYNFMDFYYGHPAVNPLVALKTLVWCSSSACCNGPLGRKLFDRFDAEVVVNGKPWPFANYSTIFAASIRQFGLGFNVFHHMLRQNRDFHAYGVSLKPRGILRHLKRMHDGKQIESEDIVDEIAERMEIRLERPLPYTIDGDMLDPRDSFIITRGPEVTVVV